MTISCPSLARQEVKLIWWTPEAHRSILTRVINEVHEIILI
jgi:hypothetical protein